MGKRGLNWVIFILGTNQFASQKGMSIGGSRSITDMDMTPMSSDSQRILTAQSGEEFNHPIRWGV